MDILNSLSKDLAMEQTKNSKWFIEKFNEGYCICYVDLMDMKREVPINTDDYQILELELAQHIVRAHNLDLERRMGKSYE